MQILCVQSLVFTPATSTTASSKNKFSDHKKTGHLSKAQASCCLFNAPLTFYLEQLVSAYTSLTLVENSSGFVKNLTLMLGFLIFKQSPNAKPLTAYSVSFHYPLTNNDK